MPEGKIGSAIYSPCNRYRYRLDRRYTESPKRILNAIMLNPSTADANSDDPTVSRCQVRARAWGFDALIVTNIFAWRATDPSELYSKTLRWRLRDDLMHFPVGSENDHHIRAAAEESDMILCAWGNHGKLDNRSSVVRGILRSVATDRLHYLKMTGENEPSHPLYLDYSLPPIPWTL